LRKLFSVSETPMKWVLLKRKLAAQGFLATEGYTPAQARKPLLGVYTNTPQKLAARRSPNQRKKTKASG
jgi:hypothetical protein